MAKADLVDLKALVVEIVRRSVLADALIGVTVESAAYDDESDFLRVKVGLRGLSAIPLARLESLASAIEDDLRELDERFPSVRFPESAIA